MFFGYPLAATAPNWLHDCLVVMVTAVHAHLDAGQQPQAWPACIPTAQRDRLRRKYGLRDRLATYAAAAAGLTPVQRAQVLTTMVEQNAIANLLSCTSNCGCLDDLPNAIKEPTTDLFVFGFKLLTDLDVRDAHYAAIYADLDSTVCPFCALEFFDPPGAPREDLDHYLAASRYPFAVANLRNLTPMGKKCNEQYKGDVDILRDAAGNRRVSFDPYNHGQIGLSLLNSVPFGQPDGETPLWQIEFVPNSARCSTWNDVFDIRTRIARDVLNPSYSGWVRAFASWFVKEKGLGDTSNERITTSIGQYLVVLTDMKLSARDALRRPVFEMLESKCALGDDRVLDFMRSLFRQAVLPQPQQQEVAA